MPLWNDVRFALRQLRKSPAFTLIVLATLGLCIGVNTAIYSVLDAVLLRPIPYPEPDRLGLMTTVARHNGVENVNDSQNGAMFEAVRDNVPSLDLAAWAGTSGVNFAAEGRLEFVQQQRVSAGYFRVLGIAPRFGREFSRAEDVAGGPPLVVLSYGFWQRIFHGDAGVLGRAIDLRGEPYTVIGIMPSEFRAAAPVDVWTPLHPSRTGEGGGSNYGVVARLQPGATWAAVGEQLRALSQNLMSTPGFPREYGKDFEERAVPLQKGLTSDTRSQLLLTWGAVLIVLIIGCVNIAGLMLARSGARQREIATRMALGANRPAIVRQLLTESLLLALGGGVLGIGIGVKALSWLKNLGAEQLQMWHPIEIDLPVMAVMLGIALLTSLLFGLAPALQTSRVDLRSVLVEGGRGVVGGRRRWTRGALVACEVALSLVLLVGAGLLVRTLSYLNGLDPGFDTRHVITAQASLQDARYKTSAAVNRLFTQSLDRIRAIPGVQSAGVALTLPFERPLNSGFKTLDGDDVQRHGVEMVYTTPGYFETLRVPVHRGRVFRDSDTPDSAQVAVVSESFARKYYKNREALGGHLNLGGGEIREIAGVVGDVQQHSGLGNFGPLSIEPTIYLPAAQTSDKFLRLIHTWFTPKWVIRTGGGGQLEAQVQAAVAAVDPQLPIARFKTIDDLRGRITLDQRYNAALFSVIAALALLLAALGLAGLIGQSVTQRTHELGVRMALGASAGQAVLTTVKPGLALALAGVAGGYVLSRLAARFLEHLLWGVRTDDAVTFTGAAGILLVVAILASLAPALRILRIDPARTLRDE
jgi:predicted permease